MKSAALDSPRRQIAPALEELADEYSDRIAVAKDDVYQSHNTAAKLGDRGIPVPTIFKDGKPASNKAGAFQTADLKRWIDHTP